MYMTYSYILVSYLIVIDRRRSLLVEVARKRLLSVEVTGSAVYIVTIDIDRL